MGIVYGKKPKFFSSLFIRIDLHFMIVIYRKMMKLTKILGNILGIFLYLMLKIH